MKENRKEQLKKRAENITVPDVLADIKKADFSAYHTDDQGIVPQSRVQRQPRQKFFAWTAGVAAATAFILIFTFVILPQMTGFDGNVYATVSMNVNGAANFSIELNESSQVVDITADTRKGSEVLETFSYKQKEYGNVLTDLLKACVDKWGLTEEQLNNNLITFEISCHDSNKKTNLQNHTQNAMAAAKQHCHDKENGGHNGHK